MEASQVSFLFPVTIGLHQRLTLNSYLVTPVMYEITKLIQEEVSWCFYFYFYFFIVLMDKIWRRINTKLEIWRETIKFRSFRFCFWESFNLWLSLLMIVFYYQTKTLVNFLCRQGLNLIYLIQLLETLPVELIGIH